MLQPCQRQAPGPLRTTNTVASGPYDTLNNFTACSVGPCAAYTSAMSITGSFTTAPPFGPNIREERISRRNWCRFVSPTA